MTSDDLALLHRKLVLIQGLAHRIAVKHTTNFRPLPDYATITDDAELIVTEVDEIIDLLALQPKETV